jgi:hypothetical protein
MNVISVTADTDLPAAVDGGGDLMAIAFGEVSTVDTFERACRKADCKAAARLRNPRLERLRRLLEEDITLDRAYHEIMRNRPAPEVLVEALMFSLRRGVGELTKPDTQRRLSELSEDQLLAVCQRLQNFKPNIAPAWPPGELEALASIWSTVHASR